MIRPNYLKKGDKIGIISTARKISKAELKAAIEEFESWDLDVILAKNLFKVQNQFAGNAKERAEDLQFMLDNSEIKAIICARGGYGSVQIVDLIDFSKFIKNPKWIVGYSDVTVLHSHINSNFNIETLHAIMPVNFKANSVQSDVQMLRKALFGEDLVYKIPAHHFTNLQSDIKAEVVGGNLSIIYSLLGSKSDLKSKNKILFIEELDEYLYHIDRMMMNIERNGHLSDIELLLVGGMTDMNDNKVPFGKNAKEIIKDFVERNSLKAVFGFPAGHISPNNPIFMGREMRVWREENYIHFTQSNE